MSYYNTTNLKGKELKARRRKSETDESDSLRVMKTYLMASPWQVYGVLWKENGEEEKYLITSIRRAMNTLARKGLIERTQYTRRSKHTGAKEYIYRFIKSK